MFCPNCGKEIKEGVSFCPSCGAKIGTPAEKVAASEPVQNVASTQGAPVNGNAEQTKTEPNGIVIVTAENKDYKSVEEILNEKIPLVDSNQKEATVGSSLNLKKNKVAAKQIGMSKIKETDVLALLDETLFNIGTRGNLFTKDAVYERVNLFLPIVLKYSDIVEVSVKKEDDKKTCRVKASTGLVWEVSQTTSYNIDEFAKMMAQLADFAKKHPEENNPNIKTSTEDENTFNTKGNIIVTLVASAIFAWNSYAICHNFSVHDGYIWAILGIIVNLFIMFAYSANVVGIFKKKMEGWTGWAGWGFFIVLFLIFGIGIGKVPYKDVLAESATPVVSQILKENLGNMAASCLYVDNIFKITNHIYSATAHLDNGNTLSISISDAEKGNIYVELNY